MPLQNRVDPYGRIFRSPARGTMMGNRGGALHNDRREIVRQHLGRRWIACLLQFKGIRRVVMTPRRYTELFFLDEAVSFAAGHRPCAECRRERFLAFQNAWHQWARAPEIDEELHRERKVTFEAPLASLPNGTFVELDGSPWLVWDDAIFLWTPECYAEKVVRPAGLVRVLTPRPTVDCFRRGYVPGVHESAARGADS